MSERGTLNQGEPHPMAQSALIYVMGHGLVELSVIMESLASCAIEGNRLAEICAETLRRMLLLKPVSDRYLLGLAWFLKERENNE